MRPPLSQWQQEVLAWIGDGCPEGVMQDFTYKTTAVALQNRRLVTVSKRGGVWRAEITSAGRHYLNHGTYPESAPSARAQPRPAPSRQPTPVPSSSPTAGSTSKPSSTPATSRQSLQGTSGQDPMRPAKRRSPTQELVDAVQAAGGVLIVQRDQSPGGRSERHYANLVTNAHRHGVVPPGKQLTAKALTWPDYEIRLVDKTIIPGTDVARRPVPVPARIAKYHSVAAAFRDNKRRHELTGTLLSRAVRVVHALAVEVERRGHQITPMRSNRNPYGYDSWACRHADVVITVNGHPQCLRVFEEGRNSANPGRLKIEIAGGYRRDHRSTCWADRASWTLEDKLPDVLREVEIRAAEDEYRRLEKEREAAERARQWEQAMAAARLELIEAHRADVLTTQAAKWEQARRLRDYITAMEHLAKQIGDPDRQEAATQWIDWARQYAEWVDPLNNALTMPPPPQPTAEALRPYLHGWSPYGPDKHGPY